MATPSSGYQPQTTVSSARRADFDLLRRVSVLEAAVAVLEAQMDVVQTLAIRSGHSSFSFNSAITEPIVGNQVRVNNASQTAATKFWISQTAFDGLEVTPILARLRSGDHIYMQDFDNASTWVRYSITANPTDDGSYWDIPVTYLAGPANVPFQKVEVQFIFTNVI